MVGFGDEQIRKFVENSFSNDVESVEEFMRQLSILNYIASLCYIPLNLVMIIDIFCFCKKKLPSTLTELYRLFTIMVLQREVVKGRQRVNNLSVVDQAVVALCRVLADIPKEAMVTVYLLCKLTYYSFFKSYSDSEERNWLGCFYYRT